MVGKDGLMGKGWQVTVSELNVRSGPGTKYQVIGSASVGNVLIAPPGGWVPVLLEDDSVGWVAAQYVREVDTEEDAQAPDSSEAPWMAIARKYLGTREIAGPQDNPQVIAWHGTTTLGADDDETPWCSSFVNGVMTEAGYKGTNSAAASSWLDWGIELAGPRYGAIVVLSRTGGNHVGFYLDNDGTRVKLLGGNQGDKVSEAWFSLGSLRGYRWPM